MGWGERASSQARSLSLTLCCLLLALPRTLSLRNTVFATFTFRLTGHLEQLGDCVTQEYSPAKKKRRRIDEVRMTWSITSICLRLRERALLIRRCVRLTLSLSLGGARMEVFLRFCSPGLRFGVVRHIQIFPERLIHFSSPQTAGRASIFLSARWSAATWCFRNSPGTLCKMAVPKNGKFCGPKGSTAFI